MMPEAVWVLYLPQCHKPFIPNPVSSALLEAMFGILFLYQEISHRFMFSQRVLPDFPINEP